MCRRFIVTSLCMLGFAAYSWPGFLNGSEPTVPRQLSELIDFRIEEKLREQAIVPAEICDDATFIRRATLDLTGRNPTSSEVLAFLKNPDSSKRSALVDRLLESPTSAVHLANVWSAWLLPEMQVVGIPNGRSGLHTWLRNRFADNLRYDRLIADLLVATGSTNTGPGSFFVSLEGKPEKIAAKTARVFLGVQLDCAECHDHPFDHWKQRDFWGFAAYFARLSADGMRSPGGVAEVTDRAEGEVTLPNSNQTIAPQPLVSTGLSGLDSGTRRQQLTLWLTARENPYLARAAINRCWSILFGRGLIEPIDDMRSTDAASHPELLRELAHEFAANGFDLRKLMAGIAKSSAYQRSSAVSKDNSISASENQATQKAAQDSYATMMIKPLTAIQLATCMQQVARDAISDANSDGRQVQSEVLALQLGKLRGDSSTATLGIVQALVTLHSDQLARVHEKDQSRLLQALSAPHLDNEKRIRWLFLSTLARPPAEEEIKPILQSLEEQKDASETPTWQADLLWALVNSTEFAMTP